MENISSELNNPGKRYIAFFDLDKTLVNANSGRLLVRQAFLKGMMPITELIKALMLSLFYKLNLLDTEKIIARMLIWLQGVPQAAINELAKEIFEKYLLVAISDDALAELKIHSDNGAAVVILSSALSQVCRTVADHLNMDDIVCTEAEAVNGILTGHTSGNLCIGSEKAVRLKEYCEKYNSNVADAWYYGDSISDLQALNIVGFPVCINPDRLLRKKATEKNWQVYFWNQ